MTTRKSDRCVLCGAAKPVMVASIHAKGWGVCLDCLESSAAMVAKNRVLLDGFQTALSLDTQGKRWAAGCASLPPSAA